MEEGRGKVQQRRVRMFLHAEVREAHFRAIDKRGGGDWVGNAVRLRMSKCSNAEVNGAQFESFAYALTFFLNKQNRR